MVARRLQEGPKTITGRLTAQALLELEEADLIKVVAVVAVTTVALVVTVEAGEGHPIQSA